MRKFNNILIIAMLSLIYSLSFQVTCFSNNSNQLNGLSIKEEEKVKTIMMQVNSPKVLTDNNDSMRYYGNKETYIDENNYSIRPVVINYHVLVPYEFIAETFGANLTWIQETKTTIIKYNGTEIHIPIDSQTIYIDGNPLDLRAPIETINEMSFIPLEDISKALSKYYYYNKGVIVISDNEITFRDKDEERYFLDHYRYYLKYIPEGPYASDEEARKDMKQIQVNTWELNSNGSKSTSVKTLTVNKELADDIVKIFNMIYNGSEQFPIKDIGCYAWRGEGSSSSHNYGLAIDINSNENYYVVRSGTKYVYDEETETYEEIEELEDKILAGSHWRPNEDPYSITPDGDVIKAFEEYGWFWAGNGWGRSHDYMHFSWTGQ